MLFFLFILLVRGFCDCFGEDCFFLDGDSLYDFVDNGIFEFCINFLKLSFFCMCLSLCD